MPLLLPERAEQFRKQGLSVKMPLLRFAFHIGNRRFRQPPAVVGRFDLGKGGPARIAGIEWIQDQRVIAKAREL